MRVLAKRERLGRVLIPALLLAVLLVLALPQLAGAASDVWGNVGPSPQVEDGGIAGRYPLTNYSLDQHFEAVEASLTGGVDVSGVPAMIAWFFASLIWLATSFLANLLITLFSFAFSLDLVNGSQATGGEGALAPVSRAIHAIYSDVFGAPWLVLAIAIAGCWAMWKALVQRRYSETAGALGLSLIYVVLALFFVAQPGTTIGSVSKWTNQMSGAFLSISSHGSPSSARQAKEDTANQLFDLLVFKPWVVLNFGGLEHCVRAGTGSGDSDPDSVAVRPLSSNPDRDAALARRLQRGTEVTADGKVCINNANKYAHRFLRYSLGAPEKDERDREYDALNDGDASDLPDAGRSSYRLGVADKPATDAMEEGGQFQRLLLALVLFVGELGAVLLLGSLAIGIILAQVLLLLLLAFSPVALVAAAIPGRGHDFFKGWLQKLAGYLLRKAAYSLILAILLAVNGALASATAQLGWLMSFGLQSLFFWAVFLQRKTLADSLIGIATGPGEPGREGTLRVLGVYAGARMGGRALRPQRRAGRSGGGGAGHLFGRRGGGGAGSGGPRRAPLFGTSHSTPVGGGYPSLDAPAPSQQPRPAARSGETARRDAEPSARATAAESGASPARDAAPKDAARRKRRRRSREASPPETPPREADQEKTKGARAPQREGKQPPGRSPVRKATSAREPRESLAEELRAERERGADAGRKGPRQQGKPDPAREPAPPKRKRRGRKGGSR
ncbi:MAG TPA: type IV secretion system protein [Solirubrobacterales bacterium]|nr:type IV secretion system protein [Solirubrobacterales bacterium]